MSGFLLDTNILSLLAPASNEAPRDLLSWLRRQDADGAVFLSVVTIHEIEKGIALLQSKGAIAKSAALKVWLTGLVATYDDKIIPIDVEIAALAGRLEAKAVAAGCAPGMADATIAAVSAARGLTLVTANVKHFAPFGIAVIPPDALV